MPSTSLPAISAGHIPSYEDKLNIKALTTLASISHDRSYITTNGKIEIHQISWGQ